MPNEEAPTSERSSNSLHKAAEILVFARQQSILLVEDTAAHAALIRRALSQDEWQIEHVTRGSDALESFGKNPYRIIFLDLSLPDTDGLSLLTKLHSLNPLAPIVVVTSTDNLPVSVEAMQKGASNYVVKGEPEETAKALKKAATTAWQEHSRRAECNLIEETKLVEMVRAERLEAIEVIVRTVCHEVNNPLTGVVALSQLLLENGSLDENIQRLADGIFRSAQEVKDVVKKLSDIRDDVIEHGGQPILKLPSPTKEP